MFGRPGSVCHRKGEDGQVVGVVPLGPEAEVLASGSFRLVG